jgi:hypothetical protein
MTEFYTAEVIPFNKVTPSIRQVKCSFCLKLKTPKEGIMDNGHGDAICFDCATICSKLIKESK